MNTSLSNKIWCNWII